MSKKPEKKSSEPKPKPKPTRVLKEDLTETVVVKHEFDHYEMGQLGEALAHATLKIKQMEKDFKVSQKQYKTDLEGLQSEIEALTNRIQAKWEERTVSCEVWLNRRTKRRELVCIDTNRIIKEIPFLDEDYQMELEFGKDGEKNAG